MPDSWRSLLRLVVVVVAVGSGCALTFVAPATAITIDGVDPTVEPILGPSTCYLEERGERPVVASFTLEILPGRRYRSSVGDGTYTLDPSERVFPIAFDGPLKTQSLSLAAVRFDDWGQSMTLNAIGTDELDYRCYRDGSAHERQQLRFFHKTPQPGRYGCFVRDGQGAAAGELEIVGGGQYRYSGTSGQFAADVLEDHNDRTARVHFTGGALNEVFTSYGEDEDTGLRRFQIRGDGPVIECGAAAEPTPPARFGPRKAPKPPRGTGGLRGLYASWQTDVLGYCGGLCWTFYTFDRGGYVYTRDPQTGLRDAQCARTLPNGLPRCEPYRLRAGNLTIGDQKPERFRRTRDGLNIGGSTFRRVVVPKDGVLLGKYESVSYIPAVLGTGGFIFQRTFTFGPGRRFTRVGFTGVSLVTTDNGTPYGEPVAGLTSRSERANEGSYRITPGTLTLKFDNGTSERLFLFLPDGKTSREPGMIHLGGDDYLRKGSKVPVG